jgi:hypothetical protein
MSLKNYKNNKFEYEQPLTYDSLNNLCYNDILLKNELEPMARGVLDFQETAEYDANKNVFIPNPSTSDDVIDKYKLFQKIQVNTFENPIWENMSITFTTENVRLIKLSFFTSAFRVENLPSTGSGRVRFAFFISTNNSEISILNSTYKTSGMIVENPLPAAGFRRYGSISMNYAFVPPAGTHKVYVGVKSHRCTAKIMESASDSRLRRFTQLYAEDLGFPFRSGEEFQNEFQK